MKTSIRNTPRLILDKFGVCKFNLSKFFTVRSGSLGHLKLIQLEFGMHFAFALDDNLKKAFTTCI